MERTTKTVAVRAGRAPQGKLPTAGLVAVVFALTALPAPCPAQDVPPPGPMTPSEQRLCELYLDVLESAVDSFEPCWTDVAEPPGSGFFDLRRYGNWCDEPYANRVTIPGNGQLVLAYAVLLGESDKAAFGRARLPREQLRDHAVRALQWCCLTSAYVDRPWPFLEGTDDEIRSGHFWKREPGARVDMLGYLTLGAALLWPELDEDTQSAFRGTATGAALTERVVRTYARPQGGNHDQVKQDLASTFGAAWMFPDDSRHDAFMDVVRASGIDMVSRPVDAANDTVADGRPVRQWYCGWNLFDDGSSDHHGRASIWYGGDLLFEGRSYIEIMAHLARSPVPETYTYPGNGFDAARTWLERLALPDGELMHPHGVEYDSAYGAGLLAFACGGTIQRDVVSADLEVRAAGLLRRHTAAVGQYDYHRGSWAKAAMALLLHRIHPGGPYGEPPAQPGADRRFGVWHYTDQRCFLQRTPDKWASFSWGPTTSREPEGPVGLVAPARESDTAPLLYCHPESLAGSVTVHYGAVWHTPAVLLAIAVPLLLSMVRLPNRALRIRQLLVIAIIAAAGAMLATYVFSGRAVASGNWSVVSHVARHARTVLGVSAMAAMFLGLLAAARRPRLSMSLLAVGIVLGAGTVVACRLVADPVLMTDPSWPVAADKPGYRFTMAEGGFSTAGRRTSPELTRTQAFVSCRRGPCVTMVVLVPRQRRTFSWTGIPLAFYRRDGLTPQRRVALESVEGPLRELGLARSAWYCVDNRLAMVACGPTPDVRHTSGIGFNWARTPGYRDRYDALSLCPLDRVPGRPGEPLADVAAAVYSGASAETARRYAAEVVNLSDRLPPGWRGLLVPTGQAEGERVLVVANFFGTSTLATVELGLAENVPLAADDTLIEDGKAVLTFDLQPLETLGRVVNLYAAAAKGEGQLRVRRVSDTRFDLEPLGAAAVSLQLRYRGPALRAATLADAAGRTLQQLNAAELASPEGTVLSVRHSANLLLE